MPVKILESKNKRIFEPTKRPGLLCLAVEEIQEATLYHDAGRLSQGRRIAFILRTKEQFDQIFAAMGVTPEAGTKLDGYVQIKEQLEPFSATNPMNGVKYPNAAARAAGLMCTVAGKPVYRETFFVHNVGDDILVPHDNITQIQEFLRGTIEPKEDMPPFKFADGTAANYQTNKESTNSDSGKSILFFDTETTGLPINWRAPVSDIDNWPRLVSIAWAIHDQLGTKISEKEYIIRPDGFTIPANATKVHAISQAFAFNHGIDIDVVLREFYESAMKADYLVAHNMDFDEKVIGAEFIRKNIDNCMEGKQKICTKDVSTAYCALPGGKWPKLSELHYKLFNESFDDAHNAATDVSITAKCFWALVKAEVISL